MLLSAAYLLCSRVLGIRGSHIKCCEAAWCAGRLTWDLLDPVQHATLYIRIGPGPCLRYVTMELVARSCGDGVQPVPCSPDIASEVRRQLSDNLSWARDCQMLADQGGPPEPEAQS